MKNETTITSEQILKQLYNTDLRRIMKILYNDYAYPFPKENANDIINEWMGNDYIGGYIGDTIRILIDNLEDNDGLSFDIDYYYNKVNICNLYLRDRFDSQISFKHNVVSMLIYDIKKGYVVNDIEKSDIDRVVNLIDDNERYDYEEECGYEYDYDEIENIINKIKIKQQ